MRKRTYHGSRGFTLIELMIVLVILGIMTPVIFRFYHEGVRKRFDYLRESSHRLRVVQVLFTYLEQDLRHANGLVDSFGGNTTDKDTLLIHALSPQDRIRLLKKTGDLAGDDPAIEHDCIIVYRINEENGLVREVHYGSIVSKSSAKGVEKKSETVAIVYGNKDTSGRIFLSHGFSKTALSGDVKTLEFGYGDKSSKGTSWVSLLISYDTSGGEAQPKESFYRIFSIG